MFINFLLVQFSFSEYVFFDVLSQDNTIKPAFSLKVQILHKLLTHLNLINFNGYKSANGNTV